MSNSLINILLSSVLKSTLLLNPLEVSDSSPALPPLADYDFLGVVLPTGLTFSRASTATDIVDGVVTGYMSNAPRLNATDGFFGCEQQRTNSLRNGQAGGATEGVIGSGGALPTNWYVDTAGGLTTEVISTGTDANGVPYVRVKISGTATGTAYRILFEPRTQITAANGQTWSSSYWTRLVAGGKTNFLSFDHEIYASTAAGAGRTSSREVLELDANFTRRMLIKTLNDALIERVSSGFYATFNIGAVIDITLDIGGCQLESGYGVTSYIPTTSAAATRASESLVSSEVSTIVGQSSGRFVVEATAAPFIGTNQMILDFGRGDEVWRLYRNSANKKIKLSRNATTTLIESDEVIENGDTFTVEIAYNDTETSMRINGGTRKTGIGSSFGNPPQYFRIGRQNDSDGAHWFGRFKSIKTYAS